MARYIDLDKANVEDIPCYYGDICRLDDVKEWLNDLQEVELASVERGKWIEKIPIGSMRFECSRCKIEYYGMPSRYCSFCGAKMTYKENIK